MTNTSVLLYNAVMIRPNHQHRTELLSQLQRVRAEEHDLLRKLAALATDEAEVQARVRRREEQIAPLRGSVLWYGDIVSPAADPDDWDANH